MPALHSRPLQVTYHANRISCASCCSFLYVLLSILLPYVAVHALGGMWTKEKLSREQPIVHPRYEILVEAYASSPADTEIVPFVWSTSQLLNDAVGSHLRPCQLRSWVEDDERDGFPDRLQYVLTVPVDVDSGERLQSISVIAGVDVRFDREFRMRMNSSLHFQAASPLPGKAWRQVADLDLRSSEPQRSLDLPQRPPCVAPTWAFERPVLAGGSPASTASILEQYARCNDTAVLNAQQPIWTPGVSSTFEAHLTVNIPAINVVRRPGLVETVKLAVVQYIAFFFPISFVLASLHGSLFRFGVITARVHHPVKQQTW